MIPISRKTFLAVTLTALASAGLALPEVARAQQPAQAAAYVISDNTTGYVLESSGGTKKLQIGSLTKIATAMVVLDWAEARKEDLNQLATVPAGASALGAPAAGGVGFAPGDRCSLRDLLYAALMQSDNQAAYTLAEHVGRAIAGAQEQPQVAFVAQMNALATKLGMARTRFLNPHGLDDLEKAVPYSTAEDLARLTRYAMERSSFRFYVSQQERKITVQSAARGAGEGFMLKNTNELLGADGIDGVKTGTTRKAGQCVILSAAKSPESVQKDGQQFITPRRINVVVLGAGDRFALGRALMAKGWRLYEGWAAQGRPQAAVNGKKR